MDGVDGGIASNSSVDMSMNSSWPLCTTGEGRRVNGVMEWMGKKVCGMRLLFALEARSAKGA